MDFLQFYLLGSSVVEVERKQVVKWLKLGAYWRVLPNFGFMLPAGFDLFF